MNHYPGGQWRADPAGSAPSGGVRPLAARPLAELDINNGDGKSESVELYREPDPHPVTTVLRQCSSELSGPGG